MNEFIHWPKPYYPLSTTWGEILLWLIEIWMKNHFVNDSSYNIVNLNPPPRKKIYKEWQIVSGKHLMLVALYRGLQIRIEQGNQNITLFKSITMFYGTNNILWNNPHIHNGCEEYST